MFGYLVDIFKEKLPSEFPDGKSANDAIYSL